MCDHDTEPPYLKGPDGQHVASERTADLGSRRRRLWDLPEACHCPVVGVCLPLGVLRRLVGKAYAGQALASDYVIHVGAVAECARRGRLSEVLQRTLESRHAQAIRHFGAAKSAETVARLWADAMQTGDIAGAFWAALTHPRCDAGLQDGLCRDMHMLQHQAGAATRADLARLDALLHENAVLARELGKLQERTTRLLAEKSASVKATAAELVQVRGDIISKESVIAFLRADLGELRASIPELDLRRQLQHKLAAMVTRQREQDARICELRQQLSQAKPQAENLVGTKSAMVPSARPASIVPTATPATVVVHHKTVLCVGGRQSKVSSYRSLIERFGARFAHHDGGLEDNSSLLDTSLAAADLVICQTACISHNAYWRVKEHCKRTGKQCVFVDNPSSAALSMRLKRIAIRDISLTDAVNESAKS